MNNKFALMFVFTLLIFIGGVLGAQCTKEQYSFYSGGEIRNYVNNHPDMQSKTKIPNDFSTCPLTDKRYSICPGSALYEYTTEDITAKKICALGVVSNNYFKVISKASSSYSSPDDNTFWYWDNSRNDGVLVWAYGGPYILDRLTCEREVCKTECSDGIDNDRDSRIDLNDKGCIDANDDNEAGEPIGYLDRVEYCQKVVGWTCDHDNNNTALDVKIYSDGPAGTGTILGTINANVRREPSVENLCGGNPYHGFSFTLPVSLKDGQPHRIYAYSVNIGTPAKDVELANTPLTFTCIPKCNQDQTIFKTLTEKSSHASLYDDASFFNQICYNNIFGTATFTNPHVCIGEKNVVLWLKTNSDSKVSTIKSSDFNIPVCYGDLKCRAVNTLQGQTCTSSEKIVASLASTTNSLVSEKDDPNYPIKICCKSQISLNSADWKNMKDESISRTDINDEVKLIAFGDKLENEEIKFTIKKQLGTIDFLVKDKIVAQETTKGSFTWRVGEDLQGNLKDANGNWNVGDYYFEVILNGDSNTKKTSGILTVSAPENNAPPFANIVSPENGNIFFLGEQIQFTQNSYDPDDDFEYTWDFGDGISLTGNSVNLQNFNPIHTYIGVQNVGQKLIQLTVKDDRGLTSSDTVSILILNSETESRKYIFSFITIPENGRTYNRLIGYDALKTYAIDVLTGANGCTKTITCFAGSCPDKTKGTPICYPSNNLIGPVLISSTPKPHDPINFCWKHDNENEDCKTGNSGVLFDKLFRNTGLHNSKLNAKLTNSDLSSSYEVSFIVSFNKPECRIIKDQNEANLLKVKLGESFWISSSTSPENTMNNCFIDDGVQGNIGDPINTCCPDGYSCQSDKCVPVLKNKCSDFKTESECIANDKNKNIAKNELGNSCDSSIGGYYGNTNICPIFNSCECKWDSSGSVSVCNPSKKNVVRHEKGNNIYEIWDINNLPSDAKTICFSTEPAITYECVLEINSEGNCNEKDFYEEKWKVNYIEVNKDGTRNVVTYPITDPNVLDKLPEECRQSLGSRTVSCERVVRLPFFDFRNLLLSILFLMIIYYIVLKKKK